MTRLEATAAAQLMLGSTAFAVRVSSRIRNERFGVMVVNEGNLWTIGHGASYSEAIDMATNEVKRMKHDYESKRSSGNDGEAAEPVQLAEGK